MPTPAHFLVFLSAALILSLTPGPGIFYVLGRTLNGGRREGALSSLGTFVGGLVHVVFAAFGLSAILATSAVAFQIVRYAGALYLIYLGITMIRTRNVQLSSSPETPSGRAKHPFYQGIITEVLNPKTALFFLSFIPQFVTPSNGTPALQFLLLGSISVSLNTMADLAVVLSAGYLAHKLKANAKFNRRQRTASGIGMIGLGFYVAASDSG